MSAHSSSPPAALNILEIFRQIISYLGDRDLVSCERVAKQWRDVIQHVGQSTRASDSKDYKQWKNKTAEEASQWNAQATHGNRFWESAMLQLREEISAFSYFEGSFIYTTSILREEGTVLLIDLRSDLRETFKINGIISDLALSPVKIAIHVEQKGFFIKDRHTQRPAEFLPMEKEILAFKLVQSTLAIVTNCNIIVRQLNNPSAREGQRNKIRPKNNMKAKLLLDKTGQNVYHFTADHSTATYRRLNMQGQLVSKGTIGIPESYKNYKVSATNNSTLGDTHTHLWIYLDNRQDFNHRRQPGRQATVHSIYYDVTSRSLKTAQYSFPWQGRTHIYRISNRFSEDGNGCYFQLQDAMATKTMMLRVPNADAEVLIREKEEEMPECFFPGGPMMYRDEKFLVRIQPDIIRFSASGFRRALPSHLDSEEMNGEVHLDEDDMSDYCYSIYERLSTPEGEVWSEPRYRTYANEADE